MKLITLLTFGLVMSVLIAIMCIVCINTLFPTLAIEWTFTNVFVIMVLRVLTSIDITVK